MPLPGLLTFNLAHRPTTVPSAQCASCSTQSEVVVPVIAKTAAAAAAACTQPDGQQQQTTTSQPRGRLLAVLDVDSDHPAAFDEEDTRQLAGLCSWLADRFAGAVPA